MGPSPNGTSVMTRFAFSGTVTRGASPRWRAYTSRAAVIHSGLRKGNGPAINGEAVHGSDAEGYLRQEFDEMGRRDVLAALGVTGDPSARDPRRRSGSGFPGRRCVAR